MALFAIDLCRLMEQKKEKKKKRGHVIDLEIFTAGDRFLLAYFRTTSKRLHQKRREAKPRGRKSGYRYLLPTQTLTWVLNSLPPLRGNKNIQTRRGGAQKC